MIKLAELKRLQGTWGVGQQIIEKDYCIGWVLKSIGENAFFKENLVFKGGTAIRKVYFPEARFSEDLDFTSLGDLQENDLKEALQQICGGVKKESGIELRPVSLDLKREIAGERAWQVRIEFVGPRKQDRDSRRLRLDITAYEKVVLPITRKLIIHPYSDSFQSQIPVYDLAEIMAEKMRTILQRVYPRDVYDVWYVMSYRKASLNYQTVEKTFLEKCAFKSVQFRDVGDFLQKIESKNLDAHWNISLKRQLKNVPHYRSVVKDLKVVLSETFRS